MTQDVEVPPEPSASAAPVPRGAFRLLLDPVFGPFFWGKLLASSGIWVHNIVAVIITYEVSRSALVVGLVSVVQFAPQLGLAPLSGTMADRGNAPRQIVIGRAMTGLGSAGLAIWLAAVGGVDGLTNAWPILATSAIVGVGFVIGGPAMQSIVPDMVRDGELASAMALNTLPMTLGRAAGPVLGALVASQLGPIPAFAIAAGSNVVFALMLALIRLPRRPRPDDDQTDYSIRAGMRYVWHDRPLFVLLMAVTVVGFASEPSTTLAPVLAADLGGDHHLVGWLTSAFGIGAAAGIVLFAWCARAVSLAALNIGGMGLMAVGFTVTALVPHTGVALAGFGTAGIGMTIAFTAISTLLQERSPVALRGRVMGLWMLGFVGSRPFAAALDGALADVASVPVALLVTVALVCVAIYLCRPGRLAAPPPVSAVPSVVAACGTS